MRSVIIAGSRTVSPTPAEIDNALRELDPCGLLWWPDEWTEVICGMAKGADYAGRAWALARGKTVHEEPVTAEQWARYGRYMAPKLRNRAMAERADGAVLFWDGLSGGTADMCIRMVARDKPCAVIPWAPVVLAGPSR